MIASILPAPLKDEPLLDFYKKIEHLLPVIHYTFTQDSSHLIVTAICQGEFGHGTGRFISDICSRWLVPGKQLPIVMSHSSSFTFQEYDQTKFFITELVFDINSEEDPSNIICHIEKLIQEIRLSVLAVEHTRKIVSMKSLTLKQKRIVLEENLASLLRRPEKNNRTLFDHAHHLVLKATGEEKIEELYKELIPLLTLTPQTFDRDLFEEIHPFLSLFGDAFKALRESKHLIRILAYQHLFKKILKHTLSNNPSHQQVSLKLLRSSLGYEQLKQPILGLLVGINLMNDHELLEEKHFFRAIQSVIPYAIKIPHSYLTDRRSDLRMRLIYLEIKKQGRVPFTPAEIAELRRRLPAEIKNCIETVTQPLFMQPNEGEVMRNILILSKELAAIDDIPQAVINFYKQSEYHLSFTVILLRVVKAQGKSLKSLIESSPFASEISDFSTKIVGTLKRKYLKEANIFEIRLNKKPFLRQDASIDLSKGRQCVISTLTHLLGEVNDFNGGMTSKQQEVLLEFKGLLKGKSQQSDFLIENFFYSLTPVYMQSLLAPPLLKTFFLMLLDALEHNFTIDPFFSKTQIVGHTFMMMLGSPHADLIEMIHTNIAQHKTLLHDVTCSKISIYDMNTLGYLMNFEDQGDYVELRNNILSTIFLWNAKLQNA